MSIYSGGSPLETSFKLAPKKLLYELFLFTLYSLWEERFTEFLLHAIFYAFLWG